MKLVIVMVYVCENCGALFSRASKQDHCPSCGTALIHSANQTERHKYALQMAKLIRNNCVDSCRFPNMVVTEISIPNCFAFKLPATALQIDSDMLLEISVEYGQSAVDPNALTANVWAREECGETLQFLMSLYLPAKEGESPREQVGRFFESLSGNKTFTAKLFDFAIQQLEYGSWAT